MIDIRKETLLSIFQVTRLVPRPARGGRPTPRPSSGGFTGGRRLEAVRIGGNWYTTLEALARFAEPAPVDDDAGSASSPHSSRSRARRANVELDKLGL